MTEAAALIDARVAALDDWRGATLARMRTLIREADPDVVETVKWRKPTNPNGVPVWEHAGILCTGEVYKGYVKLTFARGAARRCPTRPDCSTPASTAAPAARSTYEPATRSTPPRSWRWSVRRWR